MLRFDNVVLNDYYFIIIIIIISEFYEFKGTYVVFKFSNKTRERCGQCASTCTIYTSNTMHVTGYVYCRCIKKTARKLPSYQQHNPEVCMLVCASVSCQLVTMAECKLSV